MGKIKSYFRYCLNKIFKKYMLHYLDGRLTRYVHSLFKDIENFSRKEYLPNGNENQYYQYLQPLTRLDDGDDDFKDGFFFNLGSTKKMILRFTNFTNQEFTNFEIFKKKPSSETISGYKEIPISISLTIDKNGKSVLNGEEIPIQFLWYKLVSLIDDQTNFLISQQP